MSLDDALARARDARQLPPPGVRRQIRERAGISQQTVAAEIGVTREAVAGWEIYNRTPRGENLNRYLAILDRLARETLGS